VAQQRRALVAAAERKPQLFEQMGLAGVEPGRTPDSTASENVRRPARARVGMDAGGSDGAAVVIGARR
jgi:hypothetical protein